MPTAKAIFAASAQSAITFAPVSRSSVESIDFAAGAAAYTLTFTDTSPATPTLTISGGISNASSNVQRLVVAAASASRDTPQLAFIKSASAGGSGVQYSAGPTNPAAPGGGVIRFYDSSSAGAASFTVTTGAGTPPKNSTVGGEVTFSEKASAGTARFTIYGSTSKTDGDTFGNVVFHDSASAAQGTFTNIGGTVAKGDGGNTQFYEKASAGHGLFHNFGATTAKGNGGDVAFDGTATASQGHFHNHPSTASGGYGGVTSFNNNCPALAGGQGSSAGQGHFFNYGATAAGQGGGHTYFTAKYGSPTAADGTFTNYGSAVPGSSSSAGRTVFSISLPQLAAYAPNAGTATFWNLPGTSAGAPGGLTAFTVYTDEKTWPCSNAAATTDSGSGKGAKLGRGGAVNSTGPNAGNATIINLGAVTKGANGGQTTFGGASGAVSSAANAQLVATGGINGGNGGKIVFYSGSSGGTATIGLSGNGTLDVSGAGQALTLGGMNLAGGIIACSLGTRVTGLSVTGNVNILAPVAFSFSAGQGFALDTPYTILTAPNLSKLSLALFSGNGLAQGKPTFAFSGNRLLVSFSRSAGPRPTRRRAAPTSSRRRKKA